MKLRAFGAFVALCTLAATPGSIGKFKAVSFAETTPLPIKTNAAVRSTANLSDLMIFLCLWIWMILTDLHLIYR